MSDNLVKGADDSIVVYRLKTAKLDGQDLRLV